MLVPSFEPGIPLIVPSRPSRSCSSSCSSCSCMNLAPPPPHPLLDWGRPLVGPVSPSPSPSLQLSSMKPLKSGDKGASVLLWVRYWSPSGTCWVASTGRGGHGPVGFPGSVPSPGLSTVFPVPRMSDSFSPMSSSRSCVRASWVVWVAWLCPGCEACAACASIPGRPGRSCCSRRGPVARLGRGPVVC